MLASKVAHLATRSVRYFEAGSGLPVVLLHAFPLNADQWLPQLARVPHGCRLVAPDLRGFGPRASFADAARPQSIEEHALDVLEVMAHLDITEAVICGLSMGGYIALALARQAPGRVRGLVLADTRAEADSEEARAGRARLLDLLGRDGPLGIGRELTPRLLGETTVRDQPDLVVAVRQMIEASLPDGIAAGLCTLRDRPDARASLADIACPTLVVVGAEDTLTPPAVAEDLHRAMALSRLVVIPGAGHLSNLEDAVAFNAALSGFLAPLVGQLPRWTGDLSDES